MKYLSIFVLFSLFISGCSTESDKDLMAAADEHVKQGNYSEAVAAYDKIAEEHPESSLAPEALYQKAALYQNKMMKNLTEKESLLQSVDIYKKVYEKYPDSERAPMSLFMAGFIHANELQNFDAATSTYNLFLKKYPNHELASSAKDELDFMGLTPEQILEKKAAKNL